MAINFPAGLDVLVDKVDNVDDVMAVDINDVQNICEALEAKVGIDGSAVVTSHDWLLANHDHDAETIVVADHGAAATDEVVNVCYGVGAPPAAATTTIGALFIKYIA